MDACVVQTGPVCCCLMTKSFRQLIMPRLALTVQSALREMCFAGLAAASTSRSLRKRAACMMNATE
eukprot:12374737-Karenia_brevis.AAC.1